MTGLLHARKPARNARGLLSLKLRPTGSAGIDRHRVTRKPGQFKPQPISQFGVARIRNALDKRDGYTSGERKRIYGIFSEYATHASYPGVTLMTTGRANVAQVGPFFDEQKLRSWLGEMAIRLSHAAMLLLPNPDGSDMKLLLAQTHYLEVVDKWWSKYRGMKPQAVP
jgi:hypothetical protein